MASFEMRVTVYKITIEIFSIFQKYTKWTKICFIMANWQYCWLSKILPGKKIQNNWRQYLKTKEITIQLNCYSTLRFNLNTQWILRLKSWLISSKLQNVGNLYLFLFSLSLYRYTIRRVMGCQRDGKSHVWQVELYIGYGRMDQNKTNSHMKSKIKLKVIS